MDMMRVMEDRHSVRQYEDRPIDAETLSALQTEIDACNRESGLHIQLVTDEPKAFDSRMAHYGKFSGVRHYLAMIGKKGPELDEKCGYYGERLVLTAQQLGLNTCWVALTYSKIPSAFVIGPGEKLRVVISLGYGKTQGVPHRSKTIDDVVIADKQTPEWFQNGIRAALLAPTAMNQQKFVFTYKEGRVSVRPGMGFYTRLDLGIVKYHFELGAGRKMTWSRSKPLDTK